MIVLNYTHSRIRKRLFFGHQALFPSSSSEGAIARSSCSICQLSCLVRRRHCFWASADFASPPSRTTPTMTAVAPTPLDLHSVKLPRNKWPFEFYQVRRWPTRDWVKLLQDCSLALLSVLSHCSIACNRVCKDVIYIISGAFCVHSMDKIPIAVFSAVRHASNPALHISFLSYRRFSTWALLRTMLLFSGLLPISFWTYLPANQRQVAPCLACTMLRQAICPSMWQCGF